LYAARADANPNLVSSASGNGNERRDQIQVRIKRVERISMRDFNLEDRGVAQIVRGEPEGGGYIHGPSW
jgi:hypothetical protein